MKRKELDRRISQLLDRIDGELAEIRDGLIEVDSRAGRTARDLEDIALLATTTREDVERDDQRIASLERWRIA